MRLGCNTNGMVPKICKAGATVKTALLAATVALSVAAGAIGCRKTPREGDDAVIAAASSSGRLSELRLELQVCPAGAVLDRDDRLRRQRLERLRERGRVILQRPALVQVGEQLLEVLHLGPKRRIARLRLFRDTLEPPLDMLAVGDEELELDRLQIPLGIGVRAQPFSTARTASTSRMPPRSCRPVPGTSTTRTAAGVTLREPTTAATCPSLSSAIGAMPTFGLSATVAYAVISAPAFVSALKSVVFPEFASPTMPTWRAIGRSG